MAPKETKKVCNKCDKEFATIAKLKEHKRSAHATENKATCDYCGISFQRVLDMAKHVNKVHRSTDDQISCEYCPFKSFSKKAIKKHLVKNHSHHFVRKSELDSDVDDTEELQDELLELMDEKDASKRLIQNFKCSICNVVSATAYALKCHTAFKHEKRRYKCHFTNCEFSAKRRSDLRKHEEIHNDPANYKYKCRFCKYTSIKGTSLRSHMSNYHGTNKIFQCEECDETFVFLEELKKHKKLNHSEESSNIIQEDNSHFADDSHFGDDVDDYHPFSEDFLDISSPKNVIVIKELDVLKNINTQQKKDLMPCSICHKSFNTKKQYYHHMLHSHIAGERRYCCKVCGASYKRKENLIKHALEKCLKGNRNTNLNGAQMKLIGNFRCDICGDQFKNLPSMGIHMENVHLIKDYKCDHPKCFYSSTNRLLLKVHKKTHSGKKQRSQFKCHHCSHVSKRRSALKSHSLTVHKIKEIYYCDQCDEGFEYQKALFEHHESVHVEDEESETSDSDSDASIKSIESIEIKEEIDEKAIIDISIDVKEEDVLAPAFLDISKFQEIVKFDDEAPKEISKPLKIQDPEDSDDHWADEGNWGDDWNITEEPKLKPKFKPKTKPKKLILRVSVEKLNIEPYMKQPDLIFKESANDKIIYPFKCLEKDCKARLKTKKLLEAHAEVHKSHLNFRCEICKHHFASAETLATHKKIKHIEGELERAFTCDQCEASFTTEVFLRNHSIYKHTEAKQFPCKICKYKGKMKGDLTKHMRVHGDPSKYPYKCYLCTYRSINNQAIRIHMKNHHNTENVYGCMHGKCKESFKYLKELKEHRFDEHSDYESGDDNTRSDNDDVKYEIDIDDEKIDGRDKLPKKIEKLKPKYQYECDVCKMGFQLTAKFEKHKQSHIGEIRNHICETCGGAFLSSTGLRLHKSKHITERLYKCLYPDCKFAGKTAALLKGHELVHQEKSKTCKFCKFVTSSLVALRKHMERRHNFTELFECEPCEMNFKYQSELNEHQKEVHPEYLDSLKIKCDDCDYLALNTYLMDVHRRAHHDRLGPRLYPCTICGEVFYKSTKLKYHREVHLKTLRENPTKERDRLAIERGEPNIYYCDKCPKTWNTKSEIAKHMVDSHVLDQFVCSNCGKVFNTTKKHRDHVRKVHDNKNREPQLCTLCGKTFGDTPSLRRHHERWHGENPIKEKECSDCGLTFKNMGLVRRHMMAKHRGITRKCPCGMQFRALSLYENHVKICDKIPKDSSELHVPPAPRPMINCTIEGCVEEFAYKVSLIHHLEVFHGIENTSCKFKCPTCRKKFTTQEKCDEHVENAHKNDKPRPYVCLICGARFILAWHLKGHHKHVHSDERPFSCSLCSYQGKTSSAIKNHQLSHQDPADYFLKCGFCDSTFRDKPYLRKHTRKYHDTDEIFFCDNCNGGFAHQKDFDSHLNSCK